MFRALGFSPLRRKAALFGISLEDEWDSWQTVGFLAGILDFQAEVELRRAGGLGFLSGRLGTSCFSCQCKDEEFGPWRHTAGFELAIDELCTLG